jgi:hypothetical protein
VDEADSSSEDREGVKCAEGDGCRLRALVVAAGMGGLAWMPRPFSSATAMLLNGPIGTPASVHLTGILHTQPQ